MTTSKNAIEASESPPIYYFVLFYCLILVLAQFHKLYPWTLKTLTPEGQLERENNKYETQRPVGEKNKRFRDLAKFSETHIFGGTILCA